MRGRNSFTMRWMVHEPWIVGVDLQEILVALVAQVVLKVPRV